MLKVTNVETFNIQGALRGMRNPMNSWDKSDSTDGVIGANDLKLARALFNAGASHRKFMRQIFICCDITAPLYWWKEFDTYKVGTVSNSCSTMHKLHSRDLVLDDFSHEYLNNGALLALKDTISVINALRADFIITKDKSTWYQMIQLLPTSYNQLRTITMSFENIANIIDQRSNHKLDEWHTLCDFLKENTFLKNLI